MLLLLIFNICGLILHFSLFIKTHFHGFIFNILLPKNVIVTTNTFLINPNILSAEILFEMFPRHNEAAAVSESFALNLMIYVPLINK